MSFEEDLENPTLYQKQGGHTFVKVGEAEHELVSNEEPLGLPVLNFDKDKEEVNTNTNGQEQPLALPSTTT